MTVYIYISIYRWLQASLSSYAHAGSRFSEDSAVQVNLDLEIVMFLHKLNRSEYIQGYIEDALNSSKGRTSTSLHCLEMLALHFINIGKYFKLFKLIFFVKLHYCHNTNKCFQYTIWGFSFYYFYICNWCSK